MIEIQENSSIKDFNTFGIDVKARYFVEVQDLDELKLALQTAVHPKLFLLGGGSNMLLTQDVEALVLHLNLKGIELVEETDSHVTIEVMGGENWHQLVLHCLEQDWGGIENLSLIPGNVGTAPIQNIGAYGVELEDVFVGCKTLSRIDLQEHYFDKAACEFGYRDSIFKGTEKDKHIIYAVRLRLSKKDHKLHTSYGAIQDRLQAMAVTQPSIQDISKAVIAIRQSKLPDPAVLGNSGSFFKNPVVDTKTFASFHKNHPNAPYYELDDGHYKVPAGWLIDQAGLKGYRQGDAGVHDRQALVLVNHGSASGQDILALSKYVQQTVLDRFGIQLQAEVNIF